MDQAVIERNRRRDSLARQFITLGGVGILICVIGILVLLVQVTIPLFTGAEQNKLTTFPVAMEKDDQIMAVGMGKYLEKAFWVDQKAQVHLLELVKNKEVSQTAIPGFEEEKSLLSISKHDNNYLSVLAESGKAALIEVKLSPVFVGVERNKREIQLKMKSLLEFTPSQFLDKVVKFQARQGEEGAIAVALLANGNFQVLRGGSNAADEDSFIEVEETESSTQGYSIELDSEISEYVLDKNGEWLIATTKEGKLLRWQLSEEEAELYDDFYPLGEGHKITALTLVYGDQSVAIANEAGEVKTLSLVRQPAGGKRLTITHQLTTHRSKVSKLIPSIRHKSILSLDETGVINLDHLTSENHLLQFKVATGVKDFTFSGRGNGLMVLDNSGSLHLWKVETAHPEGAWKVFFGKMLYENYDEPEYVWQSSSGSDDFEAKLSLIPLMFGSLKGTLYAMLFALPLGILGGIYTNEFAGPKFRNIVKPTVEITAAIPSVIIGFIAALWLAPLIDINLLQLFMFFWVLPLGFAMFLFLWSKLRFIPKVAAVEKSREIFVIIPVVLLLFFVTQWITPPIELALFDGDFKKWILNVIGADYDQRNSIIIAFGLGFIVIPFIFTMTDDALSNVPPSLKAASEALGASRWQTLWKVLLPSASPGLFAGVILGMGRAIGETMIVLMATGNTPIIDLSAFNGMRTLSANIAVEIPEAPLDGTLYRVLFLSAVILFGFTFMINSVAEFVRSLLRKRYAQF
ncbi:MAG: ABC transporter permease subunit [SAR324 cluster bacterium]|nr:ABC transporter permease subunit [SAR324 cluster bacterium]